MLELESLCLGCKVVWLKLGSMCLRYRVEVP